MQLFITVSPTPMAYNTALGFLLLGVGIVISVYQRYASYVSVIIFFVILISVLPMVSSVVDEDSYIARFFSAYLYFANIKYMAPNTALNFTFSCLVLAMLHAKWPHQYYIIISGFFSLIVLNVSIIYLSGYFLDIETLYQWGGAKPMAFSTALGFVLLGCALVFCTLYQGLQDNRDIASYAPLVITMVLLLGTILYWRALKSHETFNSTGYPFYIPDIAFVIGCIIAVLVGLTLRYAIYSRRYANQALAESKKTKAALLLVKTTLESVKDGILVTDNKGNIVSYNQRLLEIWNVPVSFANPAKNHPILFQYLINQVQNPEAFIQHYQDTSIIHHEEDFHEIQLKDGKVFECYVRLQRIGKKIVGKVSSYRDVTERKKMLEQLTYQNTHDSLTHLPNRLLLEDRLTQAIFLASQSKRVVAVLFFNVNHFKYFNDRFGNHIGDQLLKEIAVRLNSNLVIGDTLSRIDSDQFVIVLTTLKQEEDCLAHVQKYLSILDEKFSIEGREYRLNFRAGISLYPKDCQDAEALLKFSETAMYSIDMKDEQRFHFYTEKLQLQALERVSLENELKNAIEKNEFVLHYQPIINLQTKTARGVEVLIRWNHPQRGIILPGKFIPIAEKSGLIIPIGDWVIKEVCLQLKKWNMQGLTYIRAAINISSQQLLQKDFEENICNNLIENNLKPHNLEIEITESEIMKNSKYFIRRLKSLRKLGIHIAIDDFGIGYSNLGYLRRFPFHTIKIDRSFVHGLETSMDAIAIIKSIVNMAKSLHLKVIIEGIENKEQLAFVCSLQCDEAQGFYFHRPTDAESVTTLLIEDHVYFD
ncbi:MAG: hypothetical protein A3E83_06290 [Gammaproteobacteria bacterium RIFCSPHIGHO2_12_FULL_41_20]|nr:MAG: hypothetical protein A3E83_06290 [Gammaproteobacteria bacterium RIFCSPHIGHO2_12_FULL_41_20]